MKEEQQRGKISILVASSEGVPVSFHRVKSAERALLRRSFAHEGLLSEMGFNT